ncbi:glutaredoxin domain-containing protein [Spongorhabdus nitratireducens]
MLLKLIRNGLGYIVIAIDLLTRPRKMKRAAEEQAQVDQATKNLKLYQFNGCPFCIKTRRVIHKLNLNIELRDAANNPAYRAELEQSGGKIQVPCLKITDDNGSVQWMYESSAIAEYLEQRFAGKLQPAGQS